MANISRENNITHPRLRLSKPFFYILVAILPFQLSKVLFTENSFYLGYHAFYNTMFWYLTDLVVLGLILAWLWENLPPLNLPLIKGEKGGAGEKNPLSPPLKVREGWGALGSKIISRVANDPIYLFATAFWLILATSLIFSRENLLGVYGLVKITEGLLVFVYVREKFSPRTNHKKKNFSRENIAGPNENLGLVRGKRENNSLTPQRVILWIILISACFQSLLGIYQYLTQSSVGLSLLGEEFLRPGLKGVAKFFTDGVANPLLYDFFPYLSVISDTNLVMRAYGTFPHPNVLGAFLFMAVMINVHLLYFSTPSQSPPYQGGEKKRGWFSREMVRHVPLSVTLVILTTGLVVTFARLAWGVTFMGFCLWFFWILIKYRGRHRQTIQSGGLRDSQMLYFPGRLMLIMLALLASLAINWFLFGQQIKSRIGSGSQVIVNSESVTDRKAYGSVAWDMFVKNPALGVGLRNFVVEMDEYSKERLLPHQHQPAHNIYLLILAEAGILALVSFLMILVNIVRLGIKQKTPLVGESLLIIFLGFLILGFFDHYFLSLEQGSLMFWIAAGLLAAKNN
ncbi:MAG: O-antigen ligase family protein [bacterium]|nr:O-antigen ligase family protein [bacterium]